MEKGKKPTKAHLVKKHIQSPQGLLRDSVGHTSDSAHCKVGTQVCLYTNCWALLMKSCPQKCKLPTLWNSNCACLSTFFSFGEAKVEEYHLYTDVRQWCMGVSVGALLKSGGPWDATSSICTVGAVQPSRLIFKSWISQVTLVL